MTSGSSPLVGVIGAGTMGAGIAQVAAVAGHRTIVVDSSPASLAQGQASVGRSLASATRRQLISPDAAESAKARISWTSDLSGISDAGLVIEAIVEKIDAKRELLRAVSEVVGRAVVLASNTSSLSIDAIAADVPHPERVIGLHFFNPVPAMQLVEVVPGTRTAESARDAMLHLMRSWGKRPVAVRDVPGFIVNRVARPFYAEAFAALAESIAPELIDHALVRCGGFRMGPGAGGGRGGAAGDWAGGRGSLTMDPTCRPFRSCRPRQPHARSRSPRAAVRRLSCFGKPACPSTTATPCRMALSRSMGCGSP